jgi:predicted PurR-regulated permease PerM
MANIPSLHIPPLGAGFSFMPGSTATSSPAVITLPPRRTLVPWLVVAAIIAVAYVFRATLTLAFAAFAIAYVVSPLVRRVERWGVPRPRAILLVLLGGTATVATVLAMLVPQLLKQTQHLFATIPAYSAAIQRQWIPWIRAHLHVHLPSRTEDALAHLGLRAGSLAPRLGDLLDNTLTYTVTLVEAIFTGLIVFALTFYLLMDFDSVLDGVRQLVPHRARPRTTVIVREIDDTLRHFVAGQLLVMVILGALYALSLAIIGVPAGWAIGLFAGMISFVPYLGFFVALGLAMLMAALQGHGAGPILAAMGMMVGVHILDLTLITPRILGGRAKISPVVTILALIAGGSVFGFAGVLVAIPVASVLKVLLREVVAVYKNTQFFLAGAAPPMQSMQFGAAPGALASELSGALFNATVTAGGTPIATPPAAIQPDTNSTPSSPLVTTPAESTSKP